MPPLPLLIGLPVVGVAVHVVLDLVGYRTAPLDRSIPAEEATTAAAARYQAGTMVRFAVSEAVAIVALAAAFVVASGPRTGPDRVRGHARAARGPRRPWQRPMGRTAAALERDGADSHLREVFGPPPRSGDVISGL